MFITIWFTAITISEFLRSNAKFISLLSEIGKDVSGRFLEPGMHQQNQVTGFLHSASPPKPTFIAKTVDYGHGHGKHECVLVC